MKRLRPVAVLVILSLLLCSFTASAEESRSNISYDVYTYNLNNEPVSIIAPYVGDSVITGADCGTADFSDIRDICCDEDETRLYIADAGHQRIAILDSTYAFVGEITATKQGGLNNPSGVCLSDDILYVADSGNARILCFNKDTGDFVREFKKPEIALLAEDYKYEPTRLSVDLAGRMYVIASGITNGLIYLDADGSFLGFLGAPTVTSNALDMLWRKFMTKTQIAQSEKNVPTEYNSVIMDKKGFFYVTSKSVDIPPISRLNSQGTDVLRVSGEHPSGDGWYMSDTGQESSSIFVDVMPLSDGSYMALDTSRGRIFAYNKNGELMYAFGATGSQKGTVYSPSAILKFGNRVLVTDSSTGEITLYRQTEFGELIHSASAAHSAGETEKAYDLWKSVLKACPSYYPATIAQAKIMIKQGEYQKAMQQLLSFGETKYYSAAFREARSAAVRKLFYPMIPALAAVVALVILWKRFKSRIPIVARYEKTVFYSEYRYVSYCMFHPFDGFWDVKHEKRGSRRTATVIFLLFAFLYAVRAQYSGYLVMGAVPGSGASLIAVVKIVLPLMLWCLANWCFTTLMDGKGTLDDIYTVTAYALKPYVIFSIPLLLLSHCVAADEVFIYTTLNTILIVWVLMLMFFGMITVHDYSLGKGIVTALLTLVGICLIIFLLTVFFNVLQEMTDFAQSLFKEISLRLFS